MSVQAGSKRADVRAWFAVVLIAAAAVCTFWLGGVPAVAQTNVTTPAPSHSPAPTLSPSPTPIPTSSPSPSPSPGGSTTQPNAGGSGSGEPYEPTYVNVREWLGVLATPLVLAFVVPWLNNRFEQTRAQERQAFEKTLADDRDSSEAQRQKERQAFEKVLADDRDSSEAQRQKERQTFEKALADDRREASRRSALKSYLEQMALLIRETEIANPKKKKLNQKTRSALAVASSLTRAVVAELDGRRNGQVLKFLDYAKLKAVLKEGVLDRIDLREANLENIDLSNVSLEDALLQRAKLRGAILRNARLPGANLKNADLEASNCEGAVFLDADFREANLNLAQLQHAKLARAKFSDANIQFADFSHAHLYKADFSSARNYREATFSPDVRGVKWPEGFEPQFMGITE